MCGEYNYRIVIIQLWFETVCWALNLFVYCFTLYVLYKHRGNKVYPYVITLIFAMCSVLCAERIRGVILTPIFTCSTYCTTTYCGPCDGAIGNSLQQANIHNFIPVITSPAFMVSQVIADGMMIWRCYMVWNRDYRVIVFPVMCLLAYFACCTWGLYLFTEIYLIRAHAPASVAIPGGNWFKDFLLLPVLNTITNVLPLCINAITLLLIVGRIVFVLHNINSVQAGASGRKTSAPYTRIVYVLIESQALLFVAYVLQMIGSYENEILGYLAQCLLDQVTGISPGLLIVQIALGSKSDVVGYTTEKSASTAPAKQLDSIPPLPRDLTGATTDISEAKSLHEIEIS